MFKFIAFPKLTLILNKQIDLKTKTYQKYKFCQTKIITNNDIHN